MEIDGIIDKVGKAKGVVAVSGFVSSPKKGIFRLHPFPEPQIYLEFDESDIVYSERLDEKASPLGGSLVLLKDDAKVTQVKGNRRKAETDFLAGDIVHGALKDAEPMTLAMGWAITTTTTVTGTTIPITVTWALGCFTDWVCATGTMRCLGSTICTTGAMACPGTVVVAGPSAGWMCDSHYCASEGANCPTLSGCGGGGGGGGGGGNPPNS